MDLDEIINNFLELKKWKKAMFFIMILFIFVGIFTIISGIVTLNTVVLIPVLGGILVIGGVLMYLFARHSVNKSEKLLISYLENSALTPDEILDIMTKIKS